MFFAKTWKITARQEFSFQIVLLLSPQQDTNIIRIDCLPMGIMLKYGDQASCSVQFIFTAGWRKQDVADLVLVENRIRAMLDVIALQKTQVVLQDACVLEYVDSAVDEDFQRRVAPSEKPSPEEKV
jgi:hypothetical protein